MEILKSLNEQQLDSLRAVFDSATYSSLVDEDFKKAIVGACRATQLPLTDAYLDQLFASVDVSGRGRVSWSDFSMFAIEQANITEGDSLGLQRRGRQARKDKSAQKKNPSRPGTTTSADKQTGEASASRTQSAHNKNNNNTGGEYVSSTRQGSPGSPGVTDEAGGSTGAHESDEESEDAEMDIDIFSAFHPFSVDSIIPHPFGKQVNLARYFQRQKRLVLSMNDVKGNSHVTVYDVHDGGLGMSVHGRLPKQPEIIVDWDMIPATGGVGFSNTLVCAYQGGVVQLFSLQKKHSIDDVLPFAKSLNFSETQTCLVWSSLYNRLLLGSRGGVLSIWDVDGDTIFAQEKLHTEAITKLLVRSGTVFSSSLDRFNSVKTVDVEHSVVTNAFNDHMLGGATTIAVSEDYLFSGGFESKIVQRALQTPRAQPSFLYDSADPHTSRLTCLELLPNSPLLMSSDSRGMLKVWDLRVGACLQTLNPSAAAGHKARQEKLARAGPGRQPGGSSRGTAGGAEGGKPPVPKTGINNSGFLSTPGGGGAASLPNAAAVEAAVDVGCISSICPIPKLGSVMVTNDAELVTYTSLSSSSPELVDDQRACRFFLMPSPTQMLTVHERGVKLWRLDNGHLVYATANDLVEADVSSCAIISPLRRQFILGTMDGEVKAFSVALGQQTMDMCPALQAAELLHKEVLSLHVLPKFRDYASPYVILTHEDGVTLCPMTEGGFTSAVVRLHVLVPLLERGRYKIKESRLSEDLTRLLVATTRNCVYLVDLAQVGVIVVTYPAAAPLENTIFGLLRPLDPFLAHAPPPAQTRPDSDSAGSPRTVAEPAAAAGGGGEPSTRRMSISMLAMSIVTEQRHRHESAGTVAPSPRAQAESARATRALASAQRIRQEAYWAQLQPVLAASPTAHASAHHAQLASSAIVESVAQPSSPSVHRCLLALADCLGKVALGYAQTVRRVTDQAGADKSRVPQMNTDQAAAAAALPSSAPGAVACPVEDAYPLLGEWCAAKNENTWRWFTTRQAATTVAAAGAGAPAASGRAGRGGAALSRSTGPTSPNASRYSQASRKKRGRNPILGTSFLAQVAPTPESGAAGSSSPLLVAASADGPGADGWNLLLSPSDAGGGLGGTTSQSSTLVLGGGGDSRYQLESTTPMQRPASIRLRRSALPVVTHMHYFGRLQLLVTGNEHGDVKVWDVAGVFLAAADTPGQPGRYAPVLVHEWQAHKNGFTALLGFEHPDTQLPVLVTAGVDRAVTLWSADGVVLGTLASGRQVDDRSGGNRFALPAFTLGETAPPPATVLARWGHLLDYLMERGKELDQRGPASPQRRPSAFLGGNEMPPLSLTLTGRTRRRASGARVHSAPRAHSLNDSQNSFFLTDGGSPDTRTSEQHASPLSAESPSTPPLSARPLDRSSTARHAETPPASSIVSRYTVPVLTTATIAVNCGGTETLHDTEAAAILAGLNEATPPAASPMTVFTRPYAGSSTPGSLRTSPNSYSMAVPSTATTAAAMASPTAARQKRLANKTAVLVQRKHEAEQGPSTARTPYTLARQRPATDQPRPTSGRAALSTLPPVTSQASARASKWGRMPKRHSSVSPPPSHMTRVSAASSPASPNGEPHRHSVVYAADAAGHDAGVRSAGPHTSGTVTFASSLLPPATTTVSARRGTTRRSQSEPVRGPSLSTRLVLPRL